MNDPESGRGWSVKEVAPNPKQVRLCLLVRCNAGPESRMYEDIARHGQGQMQVTQEVEMLARNVAPDDVSEGAGRCPGPGGLLNTVGCERRVTAKLQPMSIGARCIEKFEGHGLMVSGQEDAPDAGRGRIDQAVEYGG